MKYHTFLPEFHVAILSGVKHSTIRKSPKVKPGERFALRYWTGKAYRSPMGFLGTAMCTHVLDIVILPHSFLLPEAAPCIRLGKMEGFESDDALFAHFKKHYSLPFYGVLTIWDPDSFMPGAPVMDFIRWFDSRTNKDWKAIAAGVKA